MAISAWLSLLRPQQWVKNAFVAAPLFFTPSKVSSSTVLLTAAGALAFCVLASAVYIVNDAIDREADRAHPTKRRRPLAAGTVPVGGALGLAMPLAAGGLALAYVLSPGFFLIALAYVALNVAYSLVLKNVAILDVILIAVGFGLRVEAGARLVEIVPSAWILICTGLLALFLAVAKRRDDLVSALGEEHRRSLAGYNLRFLDSALAIVLGALIVSYAVYTTDAAVMARLGTESLYLTVPFVLAGLLRYLQITLVEERSGSPTAIVLTDRFIVLAVVGWLATFGGLIYL